MSDIFTDNEVRATKLLSDLIAKLELHEANESHRSLGSLKHLIDVAKNARLNKKYKDPLFFVDTPRWLGEWGNTPLEEDISSVTYEINHLVVEICGGADQVNAIRNEHNQRALHKEK